VPRDVFYRTPDGKVVLQAYVSFIDRDESTIPYEERNIEISIEEAEEMREAVWREIEEKQEKEDRGRAVWRGITERRDRPNRPLH
jgi:hypothetical protein